MIESLHKKKNIAMVAPFAPDEPDNPNKNTLTSKRIDPADDGKFDQIPRASNSNTRQPTCFCDEHGNLKFVNFICRRPILIFLISFSICIASTVVLSKLVMSEGDNPITEDSNEYDINDIRSLAYDTLRLAEETVQENYNDYLEKKRRLEGASEVNRLQESLGDVTLWIFDAKTEDGIFTKEGIPVIRAAEATILEHKNYQDYCLLEYEHRNETSGAIIDAPPECLKPLSAMNIFYASEWDSELVDEIIIEFKSDPSNIVRYNDLSLCVEFGFYCNTIPKSYTAYDKAWVSDISLKIKSIIRKWDGRGELNSNVEQVTEFMAYMNVLTTKQFNVNFFFDSNFSLENPVTMYSRSIFYWGALLNDTDTEEESEKKLKSFVLDNLMKTWNEYADTKNNEEIQTYYFMGTLIWDIIQLILISDGLKAFGSFVAVFFYLRYMLGSWFLSAVGMFEIFMSLPLAWLSFSYISQIKYFSALNVLCIFIVMAIGADDIFVFMDSYKQSSGKGFEVLNTFETRMSWVYRRSGSAMFLTSLTTCCAFLCTLFTPLAGTKSFGIFAAFVIFFDYVLVMTLFCTSVVIYHDRFENKSSCCDCTFWKKDYPTPTEIAKQNCEDGVELKMDPISKFFKEKVGPFMLRGRNRIILGIILITWIIVAVIYTSKMEPTKSAEQFLDDDHPLQIGATILSDKFPKTQVDRTTNIHFVWGLNEIDRDGVNQLLDPAYVGKASFSSDFTFDEGCQSAILDACSMLQNDKDLEEFILRRDGVRSIDCFVEQLGAFNVNQTATCADVRVGNWKDNEWEISPDTLATTMDTFVSKIACGPDQMTAKDYYKKSMGWDGENMRYAGLSIESSLLDPRGVLGEEVVRTHYDKFIQVAKDLDQSMEGICKTKTTMTDLDQKFVFMNNQKIYRTSAISGSMIGVLLAFIVLFISTKKLHLSFFATLCILLVLVSVIGSVTMLGWTLGTIEAILISILAGFSVDYVIHLAHTYNHAEGDSDERIMAAYGEMGSSVFSGMLTSVAASIPLFFCTLKFFSKFGTFLCLTIVMSWIFANFGFMCLLATFKIPMDKKWL